MSTPCFGILPIGISNTDNVCKLISFVLPVLAYATVSRTHMSCYEATEIRCRVCAASSHTSEQNFRCCTFNYEQSMYLKFVPVTLGAYCDQLGLRLISASACVAYFHYKTWSAEYAISKS